MEPDSLVGAQRAYFQSGATRPLSARRQALLALRRAVALHQDDIARALFLDLGKSKSEAYLTETGLVLQELSFLLRRLEKLLDGHASYELVREDPLVATAGTYNYPGKGSPYDEVNRERPQGARKEDAE